MIKLLLTPLIFFLLCTEGMAYASKFAYSGRLVQPNGEPVSGEPDLRFDLSYSNTPSTIEDTYTIENVPLVDGVFTVELDFSNFNTVYGGLDSTKSLLITVTNVEIPSSPIVYDAQTIRPVPMAGVAELANGLRLSCAQDEVVAFDASGNLSCASNGQGSVISVTAGSGVLVDNTDPANPIVSADWTAISSCDPGEAIQAINADGSVVCEADDNTTLTDGNGTVINAGALEVDPAAGSGLIFNATKLDTDRAVLQTRVMQACDPGKAIAVIHQNGNVTCEDVNTNLDGQTTACSDNQILKATGGNFVCANASEVGIWSLNGADTFFNGGNVGVGTSTPSQKLQVSATGANAQALVQVDGDFFPTLAIERINGTTKTNRKWQLNVGSTGNFVVDDVTGGNSVFMIEQGAPAFSFFVNSLGNFGIGTSSPSEKLEVNGNIQVSSTSDVCIDGGACLSAAAGGDITEVIAGAGLTGGASAGPATLNVDVGTAANKIVQLDGSARLPAVDGSQLTNLPNPTTSTVLSAFATGADSTITNTDTVETAFEKAQGQINANNTELAAKVNNTTSVNGKALSSSIVLSTDDVDEGTLNHYFTTTRAQTAAIVNSTTGTETTQAASVNAMKNYVTTKIGGVNQSQWTTAGTDIYYNTGKVGIGTANPARELEVKGTMGSKSETTWPMVTTTAYLAETNPPYFMTYAARGGSEASPQFVLAGDVMGHFQARSLGVTTPYSGAGMKITAAENHSASAAGSELSLTTVPLGARTPATRLHINAQGNIGIGTVNPSSALDVAGNLSISGNGNLSLKSAGTDPGDVLFETSTGTQVGRVWSTTNGVPGLNLSSGDNTSDIYIDDSGNVGVGTSAPTEKLEVNGNLKVTGEITGLRSWGYKKAPAAFVTDYKNSWNYGGGQGTSIDCVSSADGCSILKTGIYEVRCVQRSNVTTSVYIGIGINGSRATLETRANAMWNHDHTSTAGSYTESNYMGELIAGELVTCGAPSAHSASMQFSTNSYDGTLSIKRIN